jgi:hypothetical protein
MRHDVVTFVRGERKLCQQLIVEIDAQWQVFWTGSREEETRVPVMETSVSR